MSIYNLGPYIGDIPLVGGYNLGPYIGDSGGALPIQLGVKSWHSYTDPSKIIEGATAVNIAGWTDESSPGFDLSQGTPASQPTYSVDKAVFDGGDSLSTGASTIGATGLFAGVGEAWTVVVIAEFTGIGFAISKATSNNATRQMGILAASGPILAVVIRGTTTNLAHSYIAGDKVFIAVTWDGTTCLAYVDDDVAEALPVGTAIDDLVSPIQVGQRVGGFNLVGCMYQDLVFDTAKDATEIADLKTYLEGL